MCNGGIYYDKQGSWEGLHSEKVEALKSVIEEAAGMPLIVVYQFKSDLISLQEAFPKGRKFDTKKKTEDDFKKGLIPILFLHPASAAYGIDGFQYVTNIICFFSVDWNLGQRQQTIARIGAVRQFQAGLNRPVFVHQLVARSTIDEDILERIQTKKTVAEVLSDGLARRNLT
jgi:SNF2 family DNA or RNA helicase